MSPPLPGHPPGYPPPAYLHGYPGPAGYFPTYPTAYAPRPKPSFPHSQPREYHQLLRTWTYEWWRPVVGIVALVIGFLVAPLVALPIALVGAASESGDFATNLEQLATFERVTPVGMLYLNASLGLTILLAWACIRVLHGMRPRWLSSVVPRLRWEFFLVCLGLSVVALIAQLAVSLVLPVGGESDVGAGLNDITSTTAWLALIVLLTTPFQAAGEEYVFRGYLLQAVGSLVDRPWWKWVAITVTALAFASAHGLQNFPLFFDRFMFGFIAGWLAIRTGGLEAGLAMHVLNNYLAFGFALLFGNISESLTVTDVSWWNIVVTLTQSVVYAALVLLVARKMNLQTRSRPPALDVTPPLAPAPTWA